MTTFGGVDVAYSFA